MQHKPSARRQLGLIVIGYGNEMRRDDAAGLIVARRVKALGLQRVRTLVRRQLTPDLAELVAQARAVVFVDASLIGQPGTADSRPIGEAEMPQVFEHVMRPAALLAIAQALYGRRPEAWLVRVNVRDCGVGEGLSADAARGIAAAIKLILGITARLSRN